MKHIQNSTYKHINIEDLNKSGIYFLKSLIDNRYYIGSAKCFKLRFKEHHRHLILKKHTNKHLQNFVNKYGINNIKFEIKEFCKIEDLLNREQYYIDNEDFKLLFNINKYAFSTLGSKMSELNKNKLKNRMIGNLYRLNKPLSEDTKNKLSLFNKLKYEKEYMLKKELFFNNLNNFNFKCNKDSKSINWIENNKIIFTFPCVNSASFQLNLCKRAVYNVCNKKIKTTKGFYFEYVE